MNKKEYDKARYATNREKKKQQVKDNYRKNPEKKREYQRKWTKNNPTYNLSYDRLRSSSIKTSLPKRLKERKINPTEEQLEWMNIVINKYVLKYKFTKEELLGTAYLGLVAALRTQKYEEWFDLEKCIKSSVWFCLVNSFSKDIKNKKYEISLFTPMLEDTELIDIIECESNAENFDISNDAEFFKKKIRRGFIRHKKRMSKTKYSGIIFFNIWYDVQINNLTYQELADKHNIKIRAMTSLIGIVKKMFLKIKKEMEDTNPSWF